MMCHYFLGSFVPVVPFRGSDASFFHDLSTELILARLGIAEASALVGFFFSFIFFNFPPPFYASAAMILIVTLASSIPESP